MLKSIQPVQLLIFPKLEKIPYINLLLQTRKLFFSQHLSIHYTLLLTLNLVFVFLFLYAKQVPILFYNRTAIILVGSEAITPDKAIYYMGSLSFGFFLKGLKSLFEN